MKIDKAIEIKENHQRLHLDEYYQELLEADMLSIEALKRCQAQRQRRFFSIFAPLPGETDD